MKSYFLILFLAFVLFVIKSKAEKQWISVDDNYYEVDDEILDDFFNDIIKNNGYKAITAAGSNCTNQGGQCMNPANCNGTVKSGLCPGGNDNKCCIPKTKPNTGNNNTGNNNTGSGCTSKGGKCMNPANCNGNVLSGLCPGGNDNKCCIPRINPNTSNNNTGNKNTGNKNTAINCTSKGGKCMNPANCNGNVLSGLCPGGNDNKCCIPRINSNTGNNNTGNKNTGNKNTAINCTSKGGKCMNPANCNGNVLSGLCPGGNDNKCCIPRKNSNTGNNNTGNNNTVNKCTSQGGKCMNPNNCKGTVKSGLCPGGNDNKCCITSPNPNTGNNNTNNKCTKRGGKCMNPKSCSGTVISGICPGGNDNKCCITSPNPNTGNNNTGNKCTSQGGKCMNPINCKGTVKSGLCPGGNDNKCCISGPITTPSTPSTPSNPSTPNQGGNDCYNHSTIAAAAVAFAWETKDMGRSNDGTQLYRAVKDAVMPGDQYYQSCDRGVATAVLWSGADDSFPPGPTGTQDTHLSNSSLWTFVGTYDDNKDQLQPGDIAITTAERRGKKHGHIVLYVGNAEIRNKYPNSDAQFVSASYQERSPGCGDSVSAYVGGGYHIYRYNGNYNGSLKNAYTGCASGTS